ncbi:hypothetical protein PR001_g23601 [Phytophthora rubi]|nr:hypothetical protein PR001_g23601 [Phytophthora rubi]
MKFLEKVSDVDTERSLSRKMAPPLVTLLSAESEIQYVAPRNINLIVQKRTAILANEIKVFFCKYNDPIYVKMEKLESFSSSCGSLSSSSCAAQTNCDAPSTWTSRFGLPKHADYQSTSAWRCRRHVRGRLPTISRM